MILPILTLGNKILHQISEPANLDNPDLPQFIQDMIETMNNSGGIGLSAPQVGRSIRLLVYQLIKRHPKVMINPLITGRSVEEKIYSEGCLSIPGFNKYISRPRWIKVKYLDESFTPHENVFTGMESIVIQHEIDHLNGKLISDAVDKAIQHPAKSKLSKIRRGKFSSAYPVADLQIK